MTKTNVPNDDSTRDTANRAPGPRTRPRPAAGGVGATSGALISAMRSVTPGRRPPRRDAAAAVGRRDHRGPRRLPRFRR